MSSKWTKDASVNDRDPAEPGVAASKYGILFPNKEIKVYASKPDWEALDNCGEWYHMCTGKSDKI